ncbi:TPM domain-containing protein [Derxia gummosa]|uniref:TPM domain-containing protein n=1 Tax=Derxia gummosa DSM 723 TaxID=1121388 RepID=A0A8B6X192_9BURK|nr:TPM domain-containing protein [Derxia gummosa]
MTISRWRRLLRHLAWPSWRVRRALDAAVLDAIAASIAAGERRHEGELRFVIEGGLPLAELLAGTSPRARAAALFARLGVWDTERNTGVLVYVGLADRAVEIVADRGVAAAVGAARWAGICAAMQASFARADWRGGAEVGLGAIHDALAEVAPARPGNPNELPDRPVLL